MIIPIIYVYLFQENENTFQENKILSQFPEIYKYIMGIYHIDIFEFWLFVS